MKRYLHFGITIKEQRQRLSLLLLLFVIAVSAFSEGTKQIMPNKYRPTYISVKENNSPQTKFAQYNTTEEWRWNIRICNPGEKVYLGFRQDNGDVKFRIKDPNGNVVFSERTIPRNGEGYISSWERAVAGPREVVGGSGYDAYEFIPAMTGDYYIEFDSPNSRRLLRYSDITVVDASGNIQEGRNWSKAWSMNTSSFTNPFLGTLFMYSDDGIVTSVEFNGIQPYHFVISANSSGTRNTGNFEEDRKSQRGLENYPQYKIFFNDPDPDCFPTGTFGSITDDVSISGCGNDRCIDIEVDQDGYILVTLDLDGTPGYQQNTADLQIYTAVTVGDNCVPWDGRNGLGNELPDGTTINMQIDYLNGITHLPIYDVEEHDNGYTVELVRPAGGRPKLFWDDTNIPNGDTELNGCNDCHTWEYYQGNVNTINTYWYANVINTSVPIDFSNILVDANTLTIGAGSNNDTTICEGAVFQLNGGVSGATGGVWSSTGNGTFSDPSDLSGTYTPSADDENAGFVYLKLTSTGNGACPPRADSLRLSFTTPPFLNAGIDRSSACGNNPEVHLQGQANGPVIWSGGQGNYVPNDGQLSPRYRPTNAEIESGEVTFYLEYQDKGVCPDLKDSVTLTIFAPPFIDANMGVDSDTLYSCSPDGSVQLNGWVSYVDTPAVNNMGYWQGGNGSYNPSNAFVDAVYTPSNNELRRGSTVLTLNSHNRYNCNRVTDDVVLVFREVPEFTVEAGSDLCNNVESHQIQASVTLDADVEWSTSGTGSFSRNDTITPVYNFSQEDITNGSVTLLVEVIDPDLCTEIKDSIVFSFRDGPVVEIDDNELFACSNNPEVEISTNFSNSGSVEWITGSGTFFPNRQSANVTYVAGDDEIAAEVAGLVVQTTDNYGCQPSYDTVLVFFTTAPQPVINPVADVCANNNEITLSATAPGASVSVWNAGGGSFGNSQSLNTTYVPTQEEIDQGYVDFSLTSYRSGCLNEVATTRANISNSPTVEAGPVQSICSNNPETTMNGSVNVATGAAWSGGSGSFNDETALNAVYTPTQSEIDNGSVELFLTTTGNGNCLAVKDSMAITFTPSPTADAGTGIEVCANNNAITLNGSVSTSGNRWIGGNGSFSPNRTTLNPEYIPTDAEVESGSVTLINRTTNNGNCSFVSDTVIYTFRPTPEVTISTDNELCSASPTVSLSATSEAGASYTWSGGNGSFSPSNNGSNVTYEPTSTEIVNGSVSLNVSASGIDNCNAVSATEIITFEKEPSVDPGSNQTICGDVNEVQLNGSTQNSSSTIWSTNGTGSFSPDAQALTARYIPSDQDRENGVVLTLTAQALSECSEVADSISVLFTEVPTLTVAAGRDICESDFPVQLEANGSPGFWTGGTGSFTPDATAQDARYNPSSSELTAGSVTLTFTTTTSGACNPLSESVTYNLVPGPVANAGDDQTVCGDVSDIALSGSIENAGGGFWTTTGSGSFTSGASALANNYEVSPLDTTTSLASNISLVLSTTGNGVCASASDTMKVTFQPAIMLSIGPDQTYCESTNEIQLTSEFTNTDGITWTGGNGTFIPDANDPNAVYEPNDAEKTSGTLTLNLVANAVDACPELTKNVTYTFDPSPVANAGSDYTICADSSFIQLNGTVTDASGGYWLTSGSGVFSPNYATLNAEYYFSQADSALNTFTFTLVTAGNGTCDSSTSTITITKDPQPELFPGNDTTICATATALDLNATSTVDTDYEWTTNGSGVFTNPNSLATQYQPSEDDRDNQTVVLTLTTINQTLCKPVSEQLTLTIQPEPEINAGGEQTICADEETFQLSGSVNLAEGGVWSLLNGNGTFADSSVLNTEYNIASQDSINGIAELILTSTGNNFCEAVTDTFRLNLQSVPNVNAGAGIEICADTASVPLHGQVIDAGNGIWSTSGTGTFLPSAFDTVSNYVPSQEDIDAGSVVLTLTTDGNGTCSAGSDTLTITVNPAPTVDAGPFQEVCADNNSIALDGQITVAGGAYWTTNGSGTFSPDSSVLSANYIPSAADVSVGEISLTLTTADNGLCRAVSDQTRISFTPLPEVDAGSDITLCADQSSIPLNGAVENVSDLQWTSSGLGVFTPNDYDTTGLSYIPSSSDTANGQVQIVLEGEGLGECNSEYDTLIINFEPVPSLTLNALADTACALSGTTIGLEATLKNASGGMWQSSGSGAFSPSPDALSPIYRMSDADAGLNEITFTFTSNDDGICSNLTESLTVNIHPIPVIESLTDISICEDVDEVNVAARTQNANTGNWVSGGSGLFFPGSGMDSTFYDPSSDDINDGQVTLTYTTGNDFCPSVSDNLVINFLPAPTVDAGTDLSVCLGIDSVGLNGQFTNAGSVLWTTAGTGAFFPDANQTDATYLPSADDEANGAVDLTLVVLDVGTCLDYESSMTINFSPAPPIDAGEDFEVCENDFPIQLNGSGTTAEWSGGNGVFSPSPQALNATYEPTPAEISVGFIKLFLTTFKNGTCIPGRDSVEITLSPAPELDVPSSFEVCSDQSTIPLSATIGGNATGVTWRTSGEGFFNDNTLLNTTYNTDAADKDKGTISFTVETTGNNGDICSAVSESFNVTIIPAPEISTSNPITVCENNRTVQLNSAFKNADGINWTGGNGTFSSRTSTSATYIPSDAEASAGQVQLTLNSTGTVTCASQTQVVDITITPSPVLELSAAPEFCEDVNTISLSGTVAHANGLIWSTNGNGTFNNVAAANTSYRHNIQDSSMSSITFTATTSGNRNCLAVTADTTITLVNKPVVVAGSTIKDCITASSVTLDGSSVNAAGIEWTTLGSGTFVDNTSLTTDYNLTQLEKDNGGVILELKSTGSTVCEEDVDYVSVELVGSPNVIVNSGLDQIMCASENSVQLKGIVIGAEGGIWSGGNGGEFIPDSTTLLTNYLISSTDSTSGEIQFILESTGNPLCAPVTDTLRVTLLPIPEVTIPQNLSVCADTSGLELTTEVSNAGGAIWSTAGDGNFVPTAVDTITTYVFGNQDKQDGMVGITVTSQLNGPCQAVSTSTTVDIAPIPEVDAGNTFTVCANENVIDLEGSVVNAGDGVWTTSVGTGTFGSNGVNGVYDLDPSDKDKSVLTFRLTSTDNGKCRPVTDVVNVNLQDVPEINLGPAIDICILEDTLYTSATVANYNGDLLWRTSGTGRFIPAPTVMDADYIPSAEDKANGSVTLMLSTSNDDICAEVSDDVLFNIIPEPVISINLATLCEREDGVKILASTNTPVIGEWSTSGSGGFGPDPTAFDVTYYPSLQDERDQGVTLSYASTVDGVCGSASESAFIEILPLPVANAGKDRYICKNGTTLLSAGDDDKIVSYQWTNNGTAISNEKSISVTVPVQETYVLKVTDKKGCEVYDTVNIYTYDLPILTLDPHYCLYEDLVLDVVPTPDAAVPGTYQWFRGTSVLNGENTPLYAPGKAGEYQVVFDFQACNTNANTNVTVPPVLVTEDAINCIGNDVTLETTSVEKAVYNWTLDGAPTGTDNSIQVTTEEDSVLYYVEVTDSLSCVSTDSAYAIGIIRPEISIPDTSACENGTLVLKSTPDNLNLLDAYDITYIWYKERALLDLEENDSLNTSGAGEYIGFVSIGSCSNSDTSNVTIFDNPTSVLDDEIVFCSVDTPFVSLDAGEDAVNYMWSTGEDNQIIEVSEEGKYYVTLINEDNCTSEDSILVTEICPPRMFIPTGFVPGSDGKDKFFQIYGTNFTSFKITIYNRWGEVIFSSTDQEFAWDGNYKGEPVPGGVYPYIIEYEGDNPENKGPYMKDGKVTVVR